MENLNKRLNELKKRRESLNYILTKSFETEAEYNNFKAEKLSKFDELKKIIDEIRDIEWQLMSPKEQQELLRYYENISQKYSGE